MEFATRATGSQRVLRLIAHTTQLAMVTVVVGGVAFAGGGRTLAPEAPVPSSTPVPTPFPTPTPEPTPTPVPAKPSQIASPEITEAQELLTSLGYWLDEIDGKAGPKTAHAVMAFQKVEGLERTGSLTPDVLQTIRLASTPKPAFTGGGRHIEIDLGRQVLFDVDASGVVTRILPVSSGNGRAFTSQGWTRRAVTPQGKFKVQRKIAGWRISPLGALYYPSYIVGGIAIHGAPSVPGYPASHGCIRIPMHTAVEISRLMPVGTSVIVHAGGGGGVPQQRDTASPPGLDSPDASEPMEPTPTPTPTPTTTPTASPTPTPEPLPSAPLPTPTPSPDPTPEPA